MPALRQKGSVKRMVFRRGATYESQGEEDQESHSGYDLDQNAICDNYIEFCRKRLDSKRDMDRTEETQVFERIFMEGSANSSSSVIGSDEIDGMSSGAE
ncbi:hypothetical protein N0V90_008883 [Kalmusia sp. IMI 367209]|nr:hypothetical protein N0V90_008883 [Kalmusia sp. IMI 367209]